jgi:DNA topoisomerase-2
MGSNNINLLDPLGAFGSRLALGDDAASPRYIFTQLSTIAKKIFDHRDSQLLNYLDSDGITIEPEWFAPVIPMILINGSKGIATGFSTTVLKYNLVDIYNYLINLLNDKKGTKNIKPWYRGFKGAVERLASGKYRTIGCYSFNDSKRSLIITELPVGVSTDNYKEFIEEMFANKSDTTISDIRYGNSDVVVYIEIIINPKDYNRIKEMDEDSLLTKFKLISKLSATNMYLFNHNGIITKYNNIYEIINEFYQVRLDLYIKRRDAIIAVLKYELMILFNKVKFIKHVKAGKIKLQNISDNSLLAYLVDNKFDQNNGIYGKPLEEPTIKEFAYLVDIPFRSITNENAEKYEHQMQTKEIELENIIKLTAKDMWKMDLQDVLEANEITNNALIDANSSSSPVKSTGGKRVSKKKN